jgi:hypothetical protein
MLSSTLQSLANTVYAGGAWAGYNKAETQAMLLYVWDQASMVAAAHGQEPDVYYGIAEPEILNETLRMSGGSEKKKKTRKHQKKTARTRRGGAR